jgi:AraC-like DNA-binding protein
MFYLGGVSLAFFLTLLLFSKRNKTIADKILSGWLLIVTIHLLLFYFWKASLYPELLGIAIPFPLLHGPLLYLYSRALTNRTTSLRVSLLHFVPFVAVLPYLIPFIILPTEQKLFVFENRGVGYETFNWIMSLSVMVSGVLYVVLSILVLRKHRRSITQEFSNVDKINLTWLQYLIYWLGVIWLLVIFGNDDLVFGAAVLFVGFIGFFGIRQVGIFHSHQPVYQSKLIQTEVGEEKSEDNPEKRKYQKSGLSPSTAELLHSQLKNVMNNERLYCESELSLADLATRLNTQPNYLSQVINEREGKSFYDYINTLRIEEFRRLAGLPDSRKYTLLALAGQCGFNSKSSFNRYFKKVTGQSPSEFVQTTFDPRK